MLVQLSSTSDRPQKSSTSASPSQFSAAVLWRGGVTMTLGAPAPASRAAQGAMESHLLYWVTCTRSFGEFAAELQIYHSALNTRQLFLFCYFSTEEREATCEVVSVQPEGYSFPLWCASAYFETSALPHCFPRNQETETEELIVAPTVCVYTMFLEECSAIMEMNVLCLQ